MLMVQQLLRPDFKYLESLFLLHFGAHVHALLGINYKHQILSLSIYSLESCGHQPNLFPAAYWTLTAWWIYSLITIPNKNMLTLTLEPKCCTAKTRSSFIRSDPKQIIKVINGSKCHRKEETTSAYQAQTLRKYTQDHADGDAWWCSVVALQMCRGDVSGSLLFSRQPHTAE